MMGVLRTIYESYHQQFADSGFGLLLVPVLILLWKKRKESLRLQQLFEATVIVAAIILFPPTAWLVMKGIGEDVYWRSFWMLPAAVLLCWAAVRMVYRFPGRGRKVLAAAGCIALIALNGRLLFQSEFFTARENNFKLPTMVIRLADEINAHAAENGVTNKKIVATMEIAELIRVYDASILQRYGRRAMTSEERQSELYREINAGQPEYAHLAERARKAHCTYLIMHEEQNDTQAMETLGYQKIFDQNTYVIYFDPQSAQT